MNGFNWLKIRFNVCFFVRTFSRKPISMELVSFTHKKKGKTSVTINAANMLKKITFLLYHMASWSSGIGMTSDYTQDGIWWVAKTILDKQITDIWYGITHQLWCCQETNITLKNTSMLIAIGLSLETKMWNELFKQHCDHQLLKYDTAPSVIVLSLHI